MPSSRSDRETAIADLLDTIRAHWSAALACGEDDVDGSQTRRAIDAAAAALAELRARWTPEDAEAFRAELEALTQLRARLEDLLLRELTGTRSTLVELPRRRQTLQAYTRSTPTDQSLLIDA